MSAESTIQARLRLFAQRLGVFLFRNNVGQYRTENGAVIRYGVCNPGGSDLIGWTEHMVTPLDVGRKVAVFTAIETKNERGRVTAAQINFLSQVKRAGGIAGVCRNDDDAARLLAVWRMRETLPDEGATT